MVLHIKFCLYNTNENIIIAFIPNKEQKIRAKTKGVENVPFFFLSGVGIISSFQWDGAIEERRALSKQ